jgi:hypothetical protein
MIISARIAGAFRAVPDTATVSSLEGGASTYANFRSVLDQYHSSRERDSKTDGAHSGAGLPSVSTAAQDASFALARDPKSTQTADTIGATDTTTAPSTESGTSTQANLRKVIDRHHASGERDSKTDGTQGGRRQMQRDSMPARTIAAPLSATHTAEPPRLVLPSIASTILGQGGTALQNRSAAAQETSFAPETDPQSAQTSGTVRAITDATLVSSEKSAPHQYLSSREHDLKTDVTLGGRQQTQKDSGRTQTVPASLPATKMAEPSRTILSFTASVPARQDGTASRNASTASFVLETDPESAQPTGLVRTITDSAAVSSRGGGISANTNALQVLDQHHLSREHGAETDRAIRGNQRIQKDSESTQTVAAPLPATQAVEPPRLILPFTASITVRQDDTTSQSSLDAAQDATFTPAADPKVITPPALEPLDTTAASPVGSLAFAARLSPSAETQQPALNAIRTAEPQPGAQTSKQITTQITPKQVAAPADVPADTHTDEGGEQSAKERMGDRFAKPDGHLPQAHAAVPDQTATPGHNEAPASQLSPTARTEKVIDPPAAPPSTNRDITIRIPDSTDQGIAVRFLERAGEVHVSVRTGDAEMAQSLRSGLNDLANRLEEGGIRTEVWQPGSNASYSQNDSRNPFADPDGSNGRQDSSGSNPEQESRKQNQPRWLEEMEGSIGNQNFKETAHLLWQA